MSSEDLNNLQTILDLCDEVIDAEQEYRNNEPISATNSLAQNDEDNYNLFFQYCDNLLQDALSENTSEVSTTTIQYGNGETTDNTSTSTSSPHSSNKHFNIISEFERHVKLFNIRGKQIVFRMNDPPSTENCVVWFENSIDELISYILLHIPPSDYVGLTLNTPCLEMGPAWLSFRRADQLSTEVVWDTIAKILQSNAEIFSNGEFTVELTQVAMPVGRGGTSKLRGLGYAEFCKRKHGIVEINNTDNLCLPRSLIVGEAWAKNEDNFKDIVKDQNLQLQKARELCMNANVRIPEDGAGIFELTEFQRHYNMFNIVAYEFGEAATVIFEGARGSNLPRINLLHYQSHFSTIKSLTAAFACKYFCEPCHKPYKQIGRHRCEYLCDSCFRSPPCQRDTFTILCKTCNRRFRGQTCLNNHLNTALCKEIKMCVKCLKVYKNNTKSPHVCGEVFCKLCLKFSASNHKCFMRVDKKSLKTDKNLFIYFDFETRQEKQCDAKDNKEHEVNLCVVQQSCDQCCKIENIHTVCNYCGVRQHIFQKNPITQLMQYVMLPRTSFKTVTCIAHNGKSFDIQFILKYVVEYLNIKPKLILNGTKILLLEINHQIRFIDSINYLPMALSKLTKAMDLPSTVKKGYFPHYFNKLENENYIGPLPSIEYYGADSMDVSSRNNFLHWYNTQINNHAIFEMKKEIIDYCISDVDILRRACVKFRSTFLNDCGVCPFTEAITIASACNLVFRRKFLRPDTIGIIPQRGYRLSDNQSRTGLQWLIYEELNRNIQIAHAGRGKEIYLQGNLKVDGYYARSKLVFEFYGCFWHGHDLCFRSNRDKPLFKNSKETLNSRFSSTKEKSLRLRELGYTVIEMWECEFNKILKDDNNLKISLDNNPLIKTLPLNPRDALFGGRTGNTSLYYKVDGNEKIKYVDVCSLYPYVCKYAKYPVGHPTLYVGNECNNLLGPNNNFDRIEGLVKCIVLPPVNLYHPVLPRKIHGKLMFALCRTCCDNLIQEDCTHTEEERQFDGTWVADEIRRALKFGYKIVEIYEIWQYNVTTYDKTTKSGGLFVDYIDNFLKMKQESSGYPPECIDEVSKERYIQEYFEQEGIQLDPDNIKKNEGKRSLSKLMLNSFWGKFAQKENMNRTSVIGSPDELYELLANPAVVVNSIVPAGERMIYASWCHEAEAADQLRNVNVVVAAYTTAHARLLLHEYLTSLNRRVLYYDTDSIIYRYLPNQYQPPVGNFLGDLTDELECYGSGSYITEFVSGGPKNYAYKVFCTKDETIREICKVKGFTLNYINSKILNFNTLKKLIIDTPTAEPTLLTSKNIRTTLDHKVISKTEQKCYKINFMKRRRIENYDSLPYGFKRSRI